MLFLIGPKIAARTLWVKRHKFLGSGGAQVFLTTAAIAFALIWMGLLCKVTVRLGLILSLSSTGIILQSLSKKKLMRSLGGHGTFSVLLTQDISVEPRQPLIPLLRLPKVPDPRRNSSAFPTRGLMGLKRPMRPNRY